MKNNATELVLILDKSGSMSGMESDTIGGYNAMLAKQRKDAGVCHITTVLFNQQCEILHDRIELQAIRPLAGHDYCVGGSTALLDAIGTSIEKIVDVQKHTAKEYQASKVMFVIITDGMENSSRRFTLPQIQKMIKYQKERYGWEFLFIGANIDAVETAKRFGIDESRAADYVPDSRGTRLNYEVMSETVSNYRAHGVICNESLDRIRSDMKNRGGKK